MSSAQTKPAEPAPRSDRFYWALAIGVTLLAIGIRLFDLTAQSLWIDEFWTLELATGRGSVHLTLPADQVLDPPPLATRPDGAPAPWRVWTTLQTVTHPPLYFFALRLWTEITGAGDFAARLFSVLCSAAAILLLFDTARRHVGPRSALWACLLMALAAPMVEFGQNIRNYAFLIALALAAANVLTRIEQYGVTSTRLALLTLAVLATTLTHYFAVGALLALFLYGVLQLKGRDRLRTSIAFIVAGILFVVVWGSSMYAQRVIFTTTDPTTEFLKADANSSWSPVQGAAGLPLRLLIDLPLELHPYAALSGVAWLLPILLWKHRPETRLYSLWVACTIGVIALMDVTRSTTHLIYIRYTILAAPGLYVLICAAVRDRPGRPALPSILLPALAATICVIGLWLRDPINADWRSLAEHIDRQASPRDLVVFTAPDKPIWTPGYMYMALSHYSAHPLRPAVILHHRSPRLVDQWKQYPRVWLISGMTSINPAVVAPGFTVADGQLFENRIVIYQLTPSQ